jgi:formate dehydrogenase subunit delta
VDPGGEAQVSDTLVPEARLGNDVARQFGHLPHDRAVEQVAAHLDLFWERRMRRRLLALVEEGGQGLDPVLVDAARRLPPEP